MHDAPLVAVASARRAGQIVAVAFIDSTLVEVRRASPGTSHPTVELSRSYRPQTILHDGHLHVDLEVVPHTEISIDDVRAHFGTATLRGVYRRVLEHYPQLERLVPVRPDGDPVTSDRRRTLHLLTVALGMTGLGIIPTSHAQDFHQAQERAALRRPR